MIQQRTKVIDVAQRISNLKWQWANNYICRRIDDRLGNRVLVWRPCLGRRSVGQPQAKWRDIGKVAGSSWMPRTEDQAQWRAMP